MKAQAFPTLLDFMYCETKVPLSTDNACALYLLAEKLLIPTLQRAIQAYVETALSVPQTIEFITHAQQYAPQSDQLVFSADSKLCAYLVKHPEEAKNVPPHALLQILTVRQQCMKVLKGEDPRQYSGEWETQRSRLLSRVVGECVLHHHHRRHEDNLKDDDPDKKTAEHDQNATTTNIILTRPIFDKLTHKQHLPALEAGAALKLLKVDALLREEDEDDEDEKDHAKEDEDNNKEQDPATANIGSTNNSVPPAAKKKKKKKKKKPSKPFQFTCLQKRGLKALKKEWREILQNCNSQESSSDNAFSFPYLSETLQTYAPDVLTELLVQISKDYEERLVTTQRVARRTHSILNSSTAELLRPSLADSEDGTLPVHVIKQRNAPLFSCVDQEDCWSTDVGDNAQ
jgi:hypothetical protein